MIEIHLSKDSINVIKAHDGEEALLYIKENDISLTVIDIMMPKIDGFRLVRIIRQDKNIPIIILSARDDYSDKILGLDLGADDYITKPFNPLELTARIHAQLRRFHSLNPGNSGKKAKLILGKLQLDSEKCTVYKENQELTLTITEYKILLLLMENNGRVFTKKQIFEHIWEEQYYGEENAIRVHISNIRDKIALIRTLIALIVLFCLITAKKVIKPLELINTGLRRCTGKRYCQG